MGEHVHAMFLIPREVAGVDVYVRNERNITC